MGKGDKDGMKDRKSAGSRSPVPGDNAGGTKPQLSPEIQGKIGQQLRKIYDDMVNQGVPDRFADLLSRLDKPNDGESR
jgi:anti-sigma factor NepR-like protein